MRVIFALLLLMMVATPAFAFELMGDRTPMFEKRTYQSHTGLATMDYYLLKPKNYNPQRSYPLVLNLHGASGHSYGAYALASDAMRDAYPAFVLMPRLQTVSWSLPFFTDIHPEPSAHIVNLIERLEKEFSIDSKRIYVTGYSMGGFGTFEIVAQYPDFFAAAAPLCGGGTPSDAPRMVKTPMWIFHGQADRGIPVQRSQAMFAALKQAGASPIYTEYPGVGHNVWDYAYQDPKFWQWLFSQKKP